VRKAVPNVMNTTLLIFISWSENRPKTSDFQIFEFHLELHVTNQSRAKIKSKLIQ
jgi:hypothetical protein